MKHLFLRSAFTICLLFSISGTFADGGFKPGDKVNVWSLSGLPLKQKPDVKSKNLLIIPYGKTVSVLALTGKQVQVLFSNKVESYYELSGEWVNVSYKGKPGYVYDGFLSAMPPLRISKQGKTEAIKSYLSRSFGAGVATTKTGEVNGQNSNTTTTQYSNGCKLVETTYGNCLDRELFLKNITYPEAMLFEKVYQINENATDDVKMKKKWHHVILIASHRCG